MPGRQVIMSWPSHRVALAALVVLGIVAIAVGHAAWAAPETESIWAAEWIAFGPGVKTSGSLSGLYWGGSSLGLTVAAGSEDGRYESPAHDMGHGFNALAAAWQAEAPAGSVLVLEARVSADGSNWEPWQPLVADEECGPDGAHTDPTYSALLSAQGRWVQVRATLHRGTAGATPGLQMLKVITIDSSLGPRVADAPAPVSAASTPTPPRVISRAEWGANEKLMTWPPAYAPVVKIVVHHTTGSNASAELDPAAFIRAIYYYHAVTRGWGDIGYNFLVDRQGRIYEGRFGGDGVIGGHAYPYNSGTIGVAILGDYSSSSVPVAAAAGLKDLLTWKSAANNIDPLGNGWLYDRNLPNIMGHRDCNNTACPGDRAYALLPDIRNTVQQRLLAMAPEITLNGPAPGELVAGIRRLTWQTNATVSEVVIAVDGKVRRTLPAYETSWAWNTTTETDGSHLLRVTARTALGQSTHVEVPVKVDNTPPTGRLSAPQVTDRPGVTLTLECDSCSAVQFGAGWRWEGEDLRHNTGGLTADAAASNGWAWMGKAGIDGWGAWYGPYYCGLPHPGDYEASFWLRSGWTDVADEVARLDVSDQLGHRFLAPPLGVAGTDFFTSNRYQVFRLPFHYPDLGTTCRSATTEDGLELRTWYLAKADLWLDRVEIFTAPQPFEPSVWFPLPAADGSYPVEVRFVDAAGNVSVVYTRTVTVDTARVTWGQPGRAGLPVEGSPPGLLAAAAYAVSDDGVHWYDWKPVTLTLAADKLTGTVPAQPSWEGYCIRARVQHQNGKVVVSPPIRWPKAGETTPEYCWWTSCGVRLHLPLTVR